MLHSPAAPGRRRPVCPATGSSRTALFARASDSSSPPSWRDSAPHMGSRKHTAVGTAESAPATLGLDARSWKDDSDEAANGSAIVGLEPVRESAEEQPVSRVVGFDRVLVAE